MLYSNSWVKTEYISAVLVVYSAVGSWKRKGIVVLLKPSHHFSSLILVMNTKASSQVKLLHLKFKDPILLVYNPEKICCFFENQNSSLRDNDSNWLWLTDFYQESNKRESVQLFSTAFCRADMFDMVGLNSWVVSSMLSSDGGDISLCSSSLLWYLQHDNYPCEWRNPDIIPLLD